MIDLSNYNIYQNKDGRLRAYNKTTHKVTSYPRLLMELSLGRELLPSEDVHHKDGNPLNNDLNNLEVIDHREHDRMHGTQRKKYNDIFMICPICNKQFLWTREQQSHFYSKQSKSGPFCSNKCKGKNNQAIQEKKGLARKYFDKMEICAGCGKLFLCTAKTQRDRKNKKGNKHYCSIECVYNSNRKYTKNDLLNMQNKLIENNGAFSQTERELNLSPGRLRKILQKHKLPYHKKDYQNKQ